MAKLVLGVNDLSSQCPTLASEFDIDKNKPLTPTDICKGSNKKVWWLCHNGHSFQEIVSN